MKDDKVIAALVLAGGESRRMGEPKLLLAFRGRSLLAHAVANAQAVADEVLVVVGAHAEAYTPVARTAGAAVIHNPAWAEGLSSSLQAGVAALDERVARLLVVLPDQPLVSPEHLGALLAEGEKGADLVFSRYQGTRGAPALLSRRVLERVHDLRGDQGARHLVRPEDRVAEVALPTPEDIDTPEDARRFLGAVNGDPLPDGLYADLPPDVLPDVLEHLPYGVMLLEPSSGPDGQPTDLVWRLINRAAESLGLAPRHAWLGRRMSEAGPLFVESGLFASLLQGEEGEPTRFEQFIPGAWSPTGRDLWYGFKASSLESYLLVALEDISPYKALEEHIRRMAFQDELSGIYNRRYFSARSPGLLALARRQGWRVALLYLDLNGFKAINDGFGHRQGDKVLRAVAGRLRRISRESDLFFRSSGDEFALFLPDSSEASALRVAERIAERLKEPLRVGEHAHPVGASIGVVVMASEEATLDELLERADRAMYVAKKRKGLERFPTVLWRPEQDP